MKHISMNNRILIVFSAVFLLFVGMCFSVGDSYARYDNEISETVIYKEMQQTMVWDFLEQPTLKSPTVLSLDDEKDAVAATVDSELQKEDAEADGEIVKQENTNDATAVDTTQDSQENDVEEGAFQQIGQYISEEMVLLKLQFPSQCEKAVISVNGTEMFPKGLCYSLDGKAGYELNNNGYIEIDKKADIMMLLIQVPRTENNEVTVWSSLRANFFRDETVHSYIEAMLLGNMAGSYEAVLQEEMEVLKKEKSLNWRLPKLLDGFSLEIKIEYLTEKGYKDIPVEDSLKIEETLLEEEGTVNVKISNEKKKDALAGTYRAVFIMNYTEDNSKIQLQKMEIPFFVSYRE